MKIKTIRLSGNPVDPEISDKKDSEWKDGFDKICEKHGKNSPETGKALDELELQLSEKYNDLTVVDTEFPKTKEAWVDIMSKYGNIIVTTAAESNEHIEEGDLLFIVNDMMF